MELFALLLESHALHSPLYLNKPLFRYFTSHLVAVVEIQTHATYIGGGSFSAVVGEVLGEGLLFVRTVSYAL